MKKGIILITICILYSTSILGQKLSLYDLETISNKSNWEYINQYLLNKGWDYYESEKGNYIKYNTITWSYNKSSYNDKAEAWFYLFTYEGFPNKINYSVFNKESYTIIQNSLSSNGYVLTDSEIEDNELISTYKNSEFILEISTERREKKDDYSYNDNSITAYNFNLIKKSGVYDPDNGKKIDYYYGNVKKAEYTLKDGEINGLITLYHDNGQISKTGNYKNGKADGHFNEFDTDGNLTEAYYMLNDEVYGVHHYYKNGEISHSITYEDGIRNGISIFYDDGKISSSITFKDGIKNGEYIEYYYNDETGELQLKYFGNYLNDKENGTWKLLFIEDGKERKLAFENYTNGIKNGGFQDIQGDSLIIGSYKNDELNGEYKIYRDFITSLIGGAIRTDTSKLTLANIGRYSNGIKSGYWKNYDLTGSLRSEGGFLDGLENGEWKYYYTNYTNGTGENLSYSNQLYLIENYSSGKLNGKSIRYSILDKELYSCSELAEYNGSLDTCTRFIYKKVVEISNYKNDKLNGAFELRDSLNDIVAKGFFIENLKDGEWFHRYADKNEENEEVYYIYQKGNYTSDKRNGKWIQYYTEGQIAKTFNYKNGELNGEYIEWNQYDKPREKKQFISGELTELVTYDSLGVKPLNKYEIYSEKYKSYRCRWTHYLEDGFESQVYWLNKIKDFDHNWFEISFFMAINNQATDNNNEGYKSGEYKLFNSKNKPLVTGYYLKEEKNGKWSYYDYDQKVKIESNYSRNNKLDEKYYNLNGEEFYSGEYVYYDRENGIKEERKIKNGLRNGKTTYIDINTDKVIKKESFLNGELK